LAYLGEVKKSNKKPGYEELVMENEQLRKELKELKRLIFGKKSERFETQQLPGQLQLELEGEEQEKEKQQPVETQKITYERKKKRQGGRQPLPEDLPRTQIIIEPDMDTTGMVCIGEEVTEVLAKQPSTFFVIQIIRKKWAKADGSGVVIGPMPSRAIEKSIAHESLLAFILVSKFVDHLPLYRLVQIFQRQGVRVPTSTINDWVGACCRLLQPLYEALKKELLLNEYLQADESPIKVLDRNKKGTNQLGYQWGYRGKDQKRGVFDYREGRGRDGPRRILKNFSGYLQTDGYSVYEEFGKNPNITLLSCMAHARRKFVQAQDNDPERADYFLSQVQSLYHLEAGLCDQNASWDQRLEARQSLALPILKHLDQWLKTQYPQVLPKSAIGKAIQYSLKRWKLLCRYTEHGGLEIDNNLIENQIRPLALGRKYYFFAG
jgi:transposase